MKQMIAALLLALLLTGCGAARRPEEVPLPEAADPAAPTVCALSVSGGVLSGAYDGFTYTLTNNGTEEVLYGADFAIERQNGADWELLSPAEDTGFTAEARRLGPGETRTETFGFWPFFGKVTPGEYRLIKSIEGAEPLTARFNVADSGAPAPVTALENLPEAYDAAAGAADGAVSLSDRGTEGLAQVDVFLRKVARGIPARVRTVQDYGENTPMVIDVVYEKDRFSWRVRHQNAVYEQLFSYLVTDGASVCLSNAADWPTAQQYAGKELAYLLPEGTEGLEAAVTVVEAMTVDRLAGGGVRYKAWSPDGAWYAGLTADPLTYCYGNETQKRVEQVAPAALQKNGGGLETLRWLDNQTFLLLGDRDWQMEITPEAHD